MLAHFAQHIGNRFTADKRIALADPVIRFFICCIQPPRGRVLTETKTITGAGTFATSYGYDAMDRVVTTTYPSGEVVAQTLRLRSGQALQRRGAIDAGPQRNCEQTT